MGPETRVGGHQSRCCGCSQIPADPGRGGLEPCWKAMSVRPPSGEPAGLQPPALSLRQDRPAVHAPACPRSGCGGFPDTPCSAPPPCPAPLLHWALLRVLPQSAPPRRVPFRAQARPQPRSLMRSAPAHPRCKGGEWARPVRGETRRHRQPVGLVFPQSLSEQ